MPFKIVRNDITKVKADVIVNTANPNPICASGTDLAIYEAAGKEQLLAERAGIGKIARGDIAVTGAYNLKAKYIIHTVGPVWTDGKHHEFEILENCYRKSLQKALELECESIAFPLISTGVYGFPKDKALQIAVSVFSQFLTETEIEIILVVFDKRSFQLSVQIVGDIDSYIDVNYVRESHRKEYPVRSRSGSRRRELSVAGWLYDSIERTREVARATANVTHNHPEGIKGAEAFYGIPAVLIAECKSRIDKGMMTDVLDEFDHVLGRSVDTYSDEVDETQANQMIEAAIRPVLYSAG